MKSLIFSNSARTILSEVIQGTISKGGNHYDWEQTWQCAAISVPTLKRRHVGITRLKHSCNLGQNAEEVKKIWIMALLLFQNLTRHTGSPPA